ILFILAGSIANAEYLKENGEIYYKMPYYEIKSKVKDVDIESFEPLKEDREFIGDYYAKDNKYVYFYGKKLKDVLPEGFETVKENYVKDNKNVYKIEADITDSIPISSDNKINTKKISLDGLDVKTFRALENGKDVTSIDYFVDKNNIYYAYENLEKIQGADKNSFEVLGYYIAKDKNNVYLGNEKIEGADAKTFEVIDIYAGFARDKNYLYDSNERIKNSDPYTFQRINEHLVRDKNQFYSNDGTVLNVDGKSFQIVKDYEKDYFMYAKDKNKAYYINFMDGKDEMVKELKGLNPKNFKVLNGYYTKDDKKVYFSKEYADIQEVQNVDVKSFEVLYFENIETKDDFGKDKDKVYLFGLELKDVKPEKFQVVKEPITEKIIYVRDENNLFVIFYDYFSGFNFVKTKKFENIDFETLKWKSARELEDKNGKYIVNGSVIDEDKIEIKFIKK
ncbi:DKNYY domain-containing protein, partial [uncultured Leptotrichia sp.]|uniref:DKNYY domain-containing protein n=1 Tax=uncultured Leptotrichia sp. TaxID=159271 RepID=UPI002601C964